MILLMLRPMKVPNAFPPTMRKEKPKPVAAPWGINHRIKRMVSYLEQGIPSPEKENPGSATLTEWILRTI